MSEPKYDEDVVNLGYLKRALGLTDEQAQELYKYISRHYASKPQPPYYAGDTWIDGDIVYTCIKDRLIGTYQDEDWVTESGAKKEAEKKNKVFLRQPSNYAVGDMWILQSDNDHKAGKKGEMLITTVGRIDYDEDDWVNMLGYGTIRSINEVANNIKDALDRLELNKESGILTIYYLDSIPENPIEKDLWYVTDTIGNYTKGNVYKYTSGNWQLINNISTVAFEEANEARLVADGKIQSFYSDTEPTQNMGVGDIWTDTTTNKLYRYNGTRWVAVYDTNISEVRKDLETVTNRVTRVETDLGDITLEVREEISDLDGNLVSLSGQVQTIDANKVSFTDLKTNSRTEINGSYIKTGTIDASQVAVTNLNANNITSGTINGNNVNVTNINASNIKSGNLQSTNYVANTTGTKINLSDGTIDTKNFKVNSIGKMTATSAELTNAKIISSNNQAEIILDNGNICTQDANGYKGISIEGQDIKVYSYNSNNNYIGSLRSTTWNGKQDIELFIDYGDIFVLAYGSHAAATEGTVIMAANLNAAGSLDIYSDVNMHGNRIVNITDPTVQLFVSSTVYYWGYPVIGYRDYHRYYMNWTDTELQFYVDGTYVGVLSDKRLKEDVKQVDDRLLKAVSECEVSQFKAKNRNGLISVGIMAQDFQDKCKEYGINPEDYEIFKKFKMKMEDEEYYYGINYEQYLILKNQYEQQQIKELQEKDKQKDEIIANLIQRIERLEKGE